MRPLRLVFVTCRLWPLVGGSEKVMAQLAVGLTGRGHRATILTAQWQPQWPRRIRLHELPVVRLPHAPKGGWATFRYLRALGGWLRRNRAEFDLVYVSGLRHEAYAAVRAVGGDVPVVLRAERAGRGGDCLWQIDAACGRPIKARCMEAAALVAPSGAIRRELEAAGYPRARIHELPDGVPILSPRSAETRAAARAMLREAIAATEPLRGGPLALYVGPLRADRGLRQLVTAWESIVARWGDARLWLAGDGPDRKALGEQIDAMNLRHRVLLVGVFDTVDELFSAADLFVMPTLEGGGSLALREAMGAGLPIVAGDTPGNRAVLADGREALLAPAADPASLGAAIARLIERPDLAAQLGDAARRRAEAESSLAKMIDAHVTLFERLVATSLDTAARAGTRVCY